MSELRTRSRSDGGEVYGRRSSPQGSGDSEDWLTDVYVPKLLSDLTKCLKSSVR